MTWPSPTKAYHTSTYASIDPSLPALSARGKNVVITGGGSGIGPQIAEAYATASASNIALLGRTEATLKDTKSKIEGLHPSTAVSTYVADITDSVSLERAFAAFAQHVEGVHVLVANAGFLPKPESVAESSLDEWFRGFEINVKGNFNLIRAFLPHAAKDAAILNISTGVVHLPYLEKASGYHTSKLAAAKMFDYVRVEHPGFFVLNIHPGVISTAMDDKNEASRDALPHDDSK